MMQQRKHCSLLCAIAHTVLFACAEFSRMSQLRRRSKMSIASNPHLTISHSVTFNILNGDGSSASEVLNITEELLLPQV